MTYNRHELLSQLDELVSKNPRIRLSEIAVALRVDRHTLEHAMRSSRNTSFREYRRRELLQMALEMLSRSNSSIKEVAISLGYASAASFSRFIQKSTGKTPTELRKNGDSHSQ